MEPMANSQQYQHHIQQQQQHQHPMIEELLVLFQQETASCYQPADYLAYLTTTTTATASVVAEMETELTGPDEVGSISGVQRRHEYVTMRQKMGEWAYDGKSCIVLMYCILVQGVLVLVGVMIPSLLHSYTYPHTASLAFSLAFLQYCYNSD